MDLIFKTFERQRIALRRLRDSTTNEVLYGGGARGGKSYLGCGWIHMECLTKPGSAWLIAREELTKLKDTTLLTFFKTASELGIRDKFNFNAQSNTAFYNNGSIVFFREIKYVPSDPEFDRLGSYDLTGCFLDESQQIHAKAISVLRGRFSVLYGEGWSTIPKSLYTCNPAKNWIYTDFVKPDKNNTLSPDRAFVKSLATDNPFVTKDYIANLMKSDKVTKERLLFGNFEYDDDPASLMTFDKITDLFTNTFVPHGDKYITADIARFGADKTVAAAWSGFKLIDIEVLPYSSIPQSVEAITKLRNKHNVPLSNTIADEDGVGGGVVDVLKCKGFLNNGKALKDENYANLKSQCYYKMAEMVNKNEIDLSYLSDKVEVKDLLIQELEQVKQKDMDKDGKKAVVPKEKVKELIGRSPDYSDTIMMRLYFSLKRNRELF